ncbi:MULTISPECIES: flagellar hook-associated protein FlgK [unclassified Variovorax]|uniref:flagellar hook-associated protein FlgK n=1 Tax=unclassified Variovorax TaxID=663243 RepID=UPI002B234152|nr:MULTISPECIES: flagellar hook-associated protein FlgK [unclassified Variovorax]MEB0058550.1 flagellar hook-associated protein FlgK [Variovorax sp. LG9.2]MEB0112027.1 flagellar hook-associated protein FlgK [Variovorax sp. RTB1]
MSLLNVGARALLANQIALQTTGNNIANANTVGYSRQTAVMSQVPGQYTGSGYIGKGVEVSTIERAHSDFLTTQAAQAASVSSMDSTRANQLSSLEDIFTGGASGLGASVTDMLNSLSDVASTPTDITARNVVLTRADEMAARFRDAQSRLDDLQQGVKSQLGNAVTTINSLATRVAALNQQIARSQGSGQAPNDLLDQRDQAMRDLNHQVQTTTVAADDGTMSVFIGSQPLVLGSSAAPLSLTTGADGTQALTLTRANASSTIQGETLGGGAVAGLLRFQNTDLAEARNLLGRMATTITSAVNAQHKLGVDLDGNAGGNFFQPIAVPDAVPATANTGNATVGATVTDPSALAASSYQLNFGAGGSLQVTRLSDGKISNFTGPLPVQVDGLTIAVGTGTANAGDSFTLKPYAAAAGQVATAITSPRALAAASPIEARAGTTNTGNVTVSALAPAKADANMTGTVTLTFNAAGTFDVAGTGTGNPTGVAYTAGQPISFNGWNLTLKGTPKPGDTITVQAATPGYSNLNAGNATAMLGLRDATVFDGAPLSDGYASLMATVGVRSQSAQYAAGISNSIATNLETSRTSVAGVNLDEEAANLLKYQQAYQASAKMIQIAQSIFDTLLQGMH